jgi:RNA polymerase sigma-70 factor, ECF subfamily
MLRRRDPLADPEPLIRRVYSYAAYRLGDGADAEDVTSETMLRALRYRHSYDPRVGSEQAWLLGIARRALADHLAAASVRPGVPPATLTQEDTTDASIARIELRDAMATLSQYERDLLALRYGADLTAAEVGRILDERTNTVEVALHRVMTKLRARLDAVAPGHGRGRS